MRTKQKKNMVIASFRLPEDLLCHLKERVEEADLDFSKFIRHAVRREINSSKFLETGEKDYQ